jgi:hypothetical protein
MPNGIAHTSESAFATDIYVVGIWSNHTDYMVYNILVLWRRFKIAENIVTDIISTEDILADTYFVRTVF